MQIVDPGQPEQLAGSIRDGFAERFGDVPSVVCRAPGRVNLIGEHTDYNGGLCLPVALGHATYAAASARHDDRLRIASLQQAAVWEGSLDELGPGSVEGWAGYATGVVWAMREAGHDVAGVDLLVDSQVPVGAGLSSSAALECAVALTLTALAGRLLDDELRRDLVAACIRAETEVVGAPTGGMDQTVAMLAQAGAALLIDFADASAPSITQVALELAGHSLLVTDTRVSHALTDGGYGIRRADCEAAAAALGRPSLRQATRAEVAALEDDRIRRRATHVVTEIERVVAAVPALGSGDWAELGRLFAASHASMRDDFEISCAELDTSVAIAVEAGAVAARMTGGGFGGSSIAVVADERLAAVAHAIDSAFALKGYRSPMHLVAVPSVGAGIVSS